MDILPSLTKISVSLITYAYNQSERVIEHAIGMSWMDLVTGNVIPLIISLYLLFGSEGLVDAMTRKTKTQSA